MFEFHVPNSTLFELLTKYDGKVIIHDPAKTTSFSSPKPPYRAMSPWTIFPSATAMLRISSFSSFPGRRMRISYSLITLAALSLALQRPSLRPTSGCQALKSRRPYRCVRVTSRARTSTCGRSWTSSSMSSKFVAYLYLYSGSFSGSLAISRVSEQSSQPIRLTANSARSLPAHPPPCGLPRAAYSVELRLA